MSTAVVPIRPPETTLASLIEPALLNLAAHSRRAYSHGMRLYLDWLGHRPMTARSVKEWMDELREDHSTATVNLRLSAVRRLAVYAAEAGMLSDAEANKIARVKGLKIRGVRTGNWLTAEQVQAIIDSIDASTLIGRRDLAILALLFGCGLRVDEAARLEVWQLQTRDERWIIADLQGKHNRTRTVPVSPWAADLVHGWLVASGVTTGRVLRAVGNLEVIEGETLSTQSVYRRAVSLGASVGVDLASHDFRRTFGRLAAQNGADIEQIQMVYGHSNRSTTMAYLNLELDLRRAPGDAIKMRIGGAER